VKRLEDLPAQVGGPEIVLRLARAARLVVQARVPPGSKPEDGELLGLERADSMAVTRFSFELDDRGRVAITLPPGKCTFVIRMGENLWSPVQTATLVLGEPEAVREVALAPGAWITLDANACGAQVEIELACEDIQLGEGRIEPLWSSPFSVPPGNVTIAYRRAGTQVEWKHVACTAQSGGHDTIELTR